MKTKLLLLLVGMMLFSTGLYAQTLFRVMPHKTEGTDYTFPVKVVEGDIQLPAGMADSIRQDTGNALLEAINTKLPESGLADSTRQDTGNALLGDIKTALEDKSYSETIVDITLTDTENWYSYTLPTNTVAYDIKARSGYDFRVSKSNDGAYQTVWAGDTLKRTVNNGTITGTLYFNSPDFEGLVMEIRVCKKD